MSALAAAPTPNFLAIHLPSLTLPLLLRTPTLADAPAIHALLTNPLNTALDKRASPTATTATTPEQPSLSTIEGRISAWLLAATDPLPSRLNLVVVDTRTSLVVGLSGFGHISSSPLPSSSPSPPSPLPSPSPSPWPLAAPSSRTGNVGIMLAPSARGQGFGAEAIRLSVEWGFRACGFAAQSLGTLERNERMLRIVERELVPRGWKGERKWVEDRGEGEGEWEWEFGVVRERWVEERDGV